MNSDVVQWDNTEAQRYLSELGGGKSGSHAFLYDTQPDLRPYLPDGQYLAPGEDVEAFLGKIDFSVPKVVRGCDPRDVFGMVDVIRTALNVRGINDVRAAIEEVLASAKEPEVGAFVEYESGEPFDGKIGVFVQDDCGSSNRGSIVEHPHEKGVYIIGETMEILGAYTNIVQEDVCDETGRILDLLKMSGRTDPKVFKRDWGSQTKGDIINLYKGVRDSGLMPSTHSFQMEFGHDDKNNALKFYQARLFRPFQPMENFDIMDLRRAGIRPNGTTLPYGVFGVTSAQGTEVMHRGELTHSFVERLKNEGEVAYAYNNYAHHLGTPLSVMPENMGAYLPYQGKFLEHGHYRWVRRAPIALIGLGYKTNNKSKDWGDDLMSMGEPLQGIGEEIRLRVFSDGFRGVIKFEG